MMLFVDIYFFYLEYMFDFYLQNLGQNLANVCVQIIDILILMNTFNEIIPYEFKSSFEKVVLYSVCKTRTQDEVKIERFSPLLQSFLHQENSMAE